MAKPIISFQDASFSFSGGAKTIDSASLDILPSDFVAVVGPNGGGKTTLVNLMLGVFEPDSGKVLLFGSNPKRVDKSRIGYVPQHASNFDLNFPGTVLEIVSTGLIPKKGLFNSLSSSDVASAEALLKMVGMFEFKNRRIGDLSGGQKQKVLIARALIGKPDLLVLDEPTVGVDSDSQKEFYSLLKKLNKERNTTIILVSHDTSTVSNYVNKIICVNQKVISHSAVKDIGATCAFSGIHKHIVHDHGERND